MKKAFALFAGEYLAADLLTAKMMTESIPQMVYDAAVSGEWASGTIERNSRCMLRFGHYWVPIDVPKRLEVLFEAQAWRLRAKLEANTHLSADHPSPTPIEECTISTPPSTTTSPGQVPRSSLQPTVAGGDMSPLTSGKQGGAIASAPSEAPKPETTLGDRVVGEPAPAVSRPRRTPDLKSSRERIELVAVLATELATIKQDLSGFCTAKSLKSKHPQFVLWSVISDSELEEIANGVSFVPKAYAENLTLRKSGLTSRETLRKDRRKLNKAQKAQSPN